MLEKRFYAVPPQLLTTNGSVNGFITIANASILLKVKQIVNVTDTLGNHRTYEVKRVDFPDIVFLGPIGKPIGTYDDMSAYTTVNGAFLFADEQQRTKIAEQEIPRAVYAEEPTVAIRSTLVDTSGRSYGTAINPINITGSVSTSGGLVFDDIQLTRDSDGDITKAVYRLATVPVLTYDLFYDSNKDLIEVIKS